MSLHLFWRTVWEGSPRTLVGTCGDGGVGPDRRVPTNMSASRKHFCDARPRFRTLCCTQQQRQQQQKCGPPCGARRRSQGTVGNERRRSTLCVRAARSARRYKKVGGDLRATGLSGKEVVHEPPRPRRRSQRPCGCVAAWMAWAAGAAASGHERRSGGTTRTRKRSGLSSAATARKLLQ